MFFAKGLDYLLGKKNIVVDINTLPDIESPDDIKCFLISIKESLQQWNNSQQLSTIVEFLVEVSEKYDILEHLGEIWIECLQNSFDTDLLQQMLDITINLIEKNPNYFNVILIQKAIFFDFLWEILKKSSNPMEKFSVLKILQQLPQGSSLPKYLSTEPNRVNYLLDALNEPSEFLRNGTL